MKDNSNKDKAIDEYFDLIDAKKDIPLRKDEETSAKKPKTVPKNSKGGSNIKKNSKHSPVLYSASAVIIVLIIILTIFAVKSIRESASDVLKGDWLYNVYYVYEFDGKGSGAMKITDGDTYKFSYEISGDLLSIDFADYNVTDCEYSFTVEGDILTLVAVKGTITPGEKYTLDRITE
jgi:hypothetical protein